MNRPLVDRLVNALLYEGYLLYPYRPSVKNRQRWTFGGLYPPAYTEGRNGSDASSMTTECLAQGSGNSTVSITVRFLQLVARRVAPLDPPRSDWPIELATPLPFVESLRVGENIVHSWQEAIEREIPLGDLALGELVELSSSGRVWLWPRFGPRTHPRSRRVWSSASSIVREKRSRLGSRRRRSESAKASTDHGPRRESNRLTRPIARTIATPRSCTRSYQRTRFSASGMEPGSRSSIPPNPFEARPKHAGTSGPGLCSWGMRAMPTRCSPRRSSCTTIPRSRLRVPATCSTRPRSTRFSPCGS